MQSFWQDVPLSVPLEPRRTGHYPLDNVARRQLGQGRCQSAPNPADTGWPLYMSICDHLRVFVLFGATYE